MVLSAWKVFTGFVFFTIAIQTEAEAEMIGIPIGEWATLYKAHHKDGFALPRVLDAARLQSSLGCVEGSDFVLAKKNPLKYFKGVFQKYNGVLTLLSPALLYFTLTAPGERIGMYDEFKGTITTFSHHVFTGLTEEHLNEVRLVAVCFCFLCHAHTKHHAVSS